MPSLGLGYNIPHLFKKPFGALFAWGIRALDTHHEGVDDILHVVGQLPDIPGPDPLQVVELLSWHLADFAEGGVHGLELPVEELDALLRALVQVVLILQQLGELGEQGARKLHGGGVLACLLRCLSAASGVVVELIWIRRHSPRLYL